MRSNPVDAVDLVDIVDTHLRGGFLPSSRRRAVNAFLPLKSLMSLLSVRLRLVPRLQLPNLG